MKRKMILLMTAIVVGFSACRDKGDQFPSGKGCNNEGTIKKITCGLGIWQDLWIQLDNGALLQPWETDIKINVKEGDRVKFGYAVVKRDRRYDGVMNCKALPPQAEAVKITCIEVIKSEDPGTCNMEGTLRDYRKLDGCSWVIEAAAGKKYEVHRFLDNSFTPVDGQQVEFGIVPIEQVSICMVGERVDISCIRVKPNDCGQQGKLTFDTGCKAWVVETNGAFYEIQNPDIRFENNLEIQFGYNVLETFAVTCTKHTAIEITCFEALSPTRK